MTSRADYPKCATCRHYETFGSGSICANTQSLVRESRPDFGCVLHSSLDAAQQDSSGSQETGSRELARGAGMPPAAATSGGPDETIAELTLQRDEARAVIDRTLFELGEHSQAISLPAAIRALRAQLTRAQQKLAEYEGRDIFDLARALRADLATATAQLKTDRELFDARDVVETQLRREVATLTRERAGWRERAGKWGQTCAELAKDCDTVNARCDELARKLEEAPKAAYDWALSELTRELANELHESAYVSAMSCVISVRDKLGVPAVAAPSEAPPEAKPEPIATKVEPGTTLEVGATYRITEISKRDGSPNAALGDVMQAAKSTCPGIAAVSACPIKVWGGDLAWMWDDGTCCTWVTGLELVSPAGDKEQS